MFENIYFFRELDNYSFSDDDLGHISQEEKDDLTESDKSAIAGNFTINGNLKVLSEYPMQESDRQNFIYIQSFAYMNMTHGYYTHRKGFNSLLIVYTYSGQGELLYEGHTYSLKPGSCFVIDCNKEHKYYLVGNQWEHSDLHINGGNSFFIYNKFFSDTNILFQLESGDEFQYKLEQILMLHCKVSAYNGYAVHEAINNLLLYLLSNSRNTKNDKIPDTIYYLTQYLNHNFASDISLDAMSRFCGLSKYHLLREFKKYVHFTPHDYINEIRISHAKSLLSDTSIPAYKIGIIVGIENEASFIRLFKQKTGLAPGEYRKGT